MFVYVCVRVVIHMSTNETETDAFVCFGHFFSFRCLLMSNLRKGAHFYDE